MGSDSLEVEGSVSQDLLRKRESLLRDFEEVLLKEKRSAQKLKVKWAKVGDVNSKLFLKWLMIEEGGILSRS